jgi:hypothetical protein
MIFERAEIRQTLRSENDDFAINHGPVGRQMPEGWLQSFESRRPVAPARLEGGLSVAEMGLLAVSIEFNLMDPVLAGGRPVPRDRKRWLDELGKRSSLDAFELHCGAQSVAVANVLSLRFGAHA